MILMLFVPSTGVYATLQGSLCLSHRSMKATGNIKHTEHVKPFTEATNATA